MKRTKWCVRILICLLLFGMGRLGEAAEMVSPLEGAVYEPGQSFVVRVEPGAGEKLISMLVGFDEVKPNLSGISEYTVKLPLDVELGSDELIVGGIFADRNGKHQEYKLSRTITVVLPPTTVVTRIGAHFTGQKETFLDIARKSSGELVVTEGTRSTDELSVGATYSDGVRRGIASKPEIKYTSANEKVAVVIPRVGTRPIVRATGPGKTSIIVQYGEFPDRVTVQVDECPYIEGETEKKGCPLR